MKPVRGSGRVSTRSPRGPAETRRVLVNDTGTRGPAETRRVLKCKSTASGSAEHRAMPSSGRSQQSWKPLMKSSVLALENMLGLSILSVLTLRSKEKEQSQKHLNILKNQFLAECARLSVPPRRYGEVTHVSHQFRAESLKSEKGKKTLEALEGNMRSIVCASEETETKVERLEEKCRVLRNRLEEEEENRKEFLQLSEQTVLCLPAVLPQSANQATLQERIMKMVPNPCAAVKALQMPAAVEDVVAFLGLAHKQADEVQVSNTDSL